MYIFFILHLLKLVIQNLIICLKKLIINMSLNPVYELIPPINVIKTTCSSRATASARVGLSGSRAAANAIMHAANMTMTSGAGSGSRYTFSCVAIPEQSHVSACKIVGDGIIELR